MKTIIITGASSGLGLELAKIFLQEDFKVINLSKNQPKFNHINFIHIKTNLNCNKSIQRTIDEIKNNHNKFEYIFLNAGIWDFQIIEDINFKKVDEIIKINLNSNIKLISRLFNLIINNNSNILISGSINYKKPQINQISYNISKAALKSFADSLEIEFLEYNKNNIVTYISLDDFDSNLVPKIKNDNSNNSIKLKSAENIAKQIYKKYF